MHCQDSMELEEVVGRGRSVGRRTTWAGSPAKVWKGTASEHIEASVFVLGPQVQTPRSTQRTAVGDSHPAAYCFPWARDDDDETELEAYRQKIVESSCSKRCCPRNPCHRLTEKGDDDIVRAERRLRGLRRSHSFLLMYVLNLSHYHSRLRLSHSAVAAMTEMLP